MLSLTVAIALGLCTQAPTDAVGAPPADLVARIALPPVYAKCIVVEGLPIVATREVSDCALHEAAYLIRMEIGCRPDILHAIANTGVRFVVMAPTQMTTDIPEHSDLTPKAYWDRRARGLGATRERPAVSCGEENLLCIRGDPYPTENILLHEFAHTVHQMGVNRLDPTFNGRLEKAYNAAKAEGLWAGTYAMENYNEYWAEGAQSWFDSNDAVVDTREKLKKYDPRLAALLSEVFGDGPWRYVRPDRRAEAQGVGGDRGLAHLKGFSAATCAPFVWPPQAPDRNSKEAALAWIEPGAMPHASGAGPGDATTISFTNRRTHEVSVDWLDGKGQRKRYGTIAPGANFRQNTYAGHVWVISQDGKPLGAVVASIAPGTVDIK